MSTSSVSIAGSDTSTAPSPTSPTTTVSSEDQLPSESVPWILHHILKPHCSCELPLAIMFRFNSGQRPRSLRDSHNWWQLDPQGQLLNKFLSSLADQGSWTFEAQEREVITDLDTIPENESSKPAHHLDHFSMPENQPLLRKVRFIDPAPEKENPSKSVLDKYLSNESGEDQAHGLPYDFIRSFCHKAFPPEYERADFSNALSALDYLRDLEFSRRAQLRAAGRRWGVTEHNWIQSLTSNEKSKDWFHRMQHEETAIQKWFADIYVGLRIWIMINELKSPRFSRKEILAMLNTLYPPVTLSVPNDDISIKQLQWHRKIIYGWILAVEKEGPEQIIPIEEIVLKGKHGWRKVTLSLDNYLKHAHIHIQYALNTSRTSVPPVNPLSMDVGVVEGDCTCCPTGTVKNLVHPGDKSVTNNQNVGAIQAKSIQKPKIQIALPTLSKSGQGQTMKRFGFVPPPLPDDSSLFPAPLFSSSSLTSNNLHFLEQEYAPPPLRKPRSLASILSRKEKVDSKMIPGAESQKAPSVLPPQTLRTRRSLRDLLSGKGNEKEVAGPSPLSGEVLGGEKGEEIAEESYFLPPSPQLVKEKRSWKDLFGRRGGGRVPPLSNLLKKKSGAGAGAMSEKEN